jgi:hypothetical protein
VIGCVGGIGGLGGLGGVTEVAGSIHINSIVLFLCLVFIFSSFPPSFYHISHLIFSKSASRMNSIHSVRKMFHRTGGVSREREFFLDVWEVLEVLEVSQRSRVRFTSTQLCFLFSYCHLFIFCSFILSYLNIAYLIFHISYFQK